MKHRDQATTIRELSLDTCRHASGAGRLAAHSFDVKFEGATAASKNEDHFNDFWGLHTWDGQQGG